MDLDLFSYLTHFLTNIGWMLNSILGVLRHPQIDRQLHPCLVAWF